MNTSAAAASFVNGIANTICGPEKVEFELSKKPVWLLGILYDSDIQLNELMNDIRSRLWFTYRKGFKKIGNIGPDTDRGWGCMLRCGQMVIAQALVLKYLGRGWRWSPQDDKNNDKYLKILNMFADKKTSIYSIHQIALMRSPENKRVDEWFGPNSIAQTLRKLSEFDDQNQLAVYVALDNMVIIDKIKTFWAKGTRKDLVLFIPLRLGLIDLNPIYYEPLKNSFKLKNSLGIIGGKPSHALYFIGFSEKELICLDPHTTQMYMDMSGSDLHIDSSYHQENALKIPLSQLDPSVALCFYFDCEEDFDEWCNLARRFLINEVDQPLFEICKNVEYSLSSDLLDFENPEFEHLSTNSINSFHDDQVESDEEFEILSNDL